SSTSASGPPGAWIRAARIESGRGRHVCACAGAVTRAKASSRAWMEGVVRIVGILGGPSCGTPLRGGIGAVGGESSAGGAEASPACPGPGGFAAAWRLGIVRRCSPAWTCMSQHPEWVLFSRAFHESRINDALTLGHRLLRDYPDEYWLHWHRAACLEKLERFDAIEAALDRALELEPAFVRAIVMRARYAGFDDLPPDEGWDDNDEPTPEQRAFDARAE